MYTVNPFKVYRFTGQNGAVIRYTVDCSGSTKETDYPAAAIFPVSAMFPNEFQYKQAHAYCDYLNKIRDATMQAFEQNHLVDLLSRETK